MPRLVARKGSKKPSLQKRVDDRASDQTGDYFGKSFVRNAPAFKSPVTALASGATFFFKEGLCGNG
jgi:hypothetical protein